MERNWSEAARRALAAYPWQTPSDRARAEREAELVAFGDFVEVEDLPLAVRQWLRRRRQEAPGAVDWRGKSLKTLVEDFERRILASALAENGGNVAATARALDSTVRIVTYKARKYKLTQGKEK